MNERNTPPTPDETPPPTGAPPSPGPPADVPASPWSGTPPPPASATPEIDVDDILAQKSKRVRLLGTGGHSDVWLVEHLGQLEAHKFLNRSTGAEAAIFREALHTRKVEHPNILKVFGTEDVDGTPVLRMEYVEGRDLYTLVDEDGILPVQKLLPIAIQVADALHATHDRGIIHRDLKPSNIIQRRGSDQVVVTDFGISAAMDAETAGGASATGTPRFIAPELYELGGHGTPGSDIWSLGVTLVYLVTLNYPFRFGELEAAEAVKEEPRDLSQSHLYVPPEFQQVLRKMLAVDPKERFTGMQDVKQELELLLSSMACPDCGQTFRLESVGHACPNPDCQSANIAPCKRAIQARQEAETRLAECDFKGARKAFRKALKAFEEAQAAERVEEVQQRLDGIDEYEKSLDERIHAATADLKRDRIIDALHTIQKARSRFSRSGPLRELRGKLRNRLRELYVAADPDARRALGQQDFRSAREILNKIDQILGDSVSRRELAAVLGEEPQGFHQLYHDAEQKELTFEQYKSRAEQAILAFDFEKALRVFTALETEFPSEEHVDMLARLRRAPAIYEYSRKYKAESLQRVIANPAQLAQAKRIRIKKVNQACAKLIEDFPVEEYPTFSEIQELKELTTTCIDVVRKYVEDKLQEAAQSEEDQQASDELQIIREIEGLVTRSDLFDVATRQHVIHRIRNLEEVMAKADAHYHDGMSALEQREYVQAQVSLREVLKLIPSGYRDVETQLESVNDLRQQLGALRQESVYELGEIERGRFTSESAAEGLKKAAEYYNLAGDMARVKFRQRLAQASMALLESQREHLALQQEAHTDAFLASSFMPLMKTLPAGLWTDLLGDSADLSRTFCAVLNEASGGSRASRGIETEIEEARRFCEALAPVQELVRSVKPPLGSNHPADMLLKRLTSAFEVAKRGDKETSLIATVAQIREIEPLAPGPVRQAMTSAVEKLEAWGRRAAVESMVRNVTDFVRKYALHAAALVVGVAIGWYFFSGDADEIRDAELKKLAAAFASEGVPASDLVPMLARDRDGGHARFLAAWRDLRDDLVDTEAGKRKIPASRWAAHMRLRPKRSVLKGNKKLVKRLDKDIARAGHHAVQLHLAEAMSDAYARSESVSRQLLERLGRMKTDLGGKLEEFPIDDIVRFVRDPGTALPNVGNEDTRARLADWRRVKKRSGGLNTLADVLRAAVQNEQRDPDAFQAELQRIVEALPDVGAGAPPLDLDHNLAAMDFEDVAAAAAAILARGS